MLQPIDTADALSALALSNNAMRAFARDAQSHVHLFGSVESPSTMVIRGAGIIALHRAEPRAVFEVMCLRRPFERLLRDFEKLCAAFVVFTLDDHTRPVIKAHGVTSLAQRELCALSIDPLTSAEAQALREKLARLVNRDSARRRAPRGH